MNTSYRQSALSFGGLLEIMGLFFDLVGSNMDCILCSFLDVLTNFTGLVLDITSNLDNLLLGIMSFVSSLIG